MRQRHPRLARRAEPAWGKLLRVENAFEVLIQIIGATEKEPVDDRDYQCHLEGGAPKH